LGVALVALGLLAPTAAAAAIAPAPPLQGPKPQAGPKPQLLLFHGGSFLFEDPQFQPSTAERARAAGFVPHYVTYPLGDLPAAVARARAEARRLRLKFGLDRVYAYGSSAGGTLAALLSGDGLVAAAVAKAPVSDLVGWEWPLQRYGPAYYEEIGAGLAARYRLSPLRRPAKSPLLIYQGRGDQVVPPAMSEAFAAKFARVHLWLVAGGHTTERARPWLIGRAMRWLERTAVRQARAANRNNPLP
jgi:acetyl esterase/lipase